MSIEKKLIDNLGKELDLSEDKIEVIAFGYRLFIYSIWGYLFIILVSYILGTLPATLTAAITASLFRIFSGGVHASSQKKCVIFGAVIFNLLGLIVNLFSNDASWKLVNGLVWITVVITLVSFILYAPADTPGKPITTKVQIKKLKGISIVLLFIWCIFVHYVFKGEININKLYLLASTAGLAWQSVSLWPITYKLPIYK